MGKKSSRVDLTIYLAKKGISPVAIIKDHQLHKNFSLKLPGAKSAIVYVKKQTHSTPRWASFLDTHINASEFGRNSSTGAVLLIELPNSTFLLTFGQGHHLIDSLHLEMNFGLKVALNLVDPDSLRSIDKASFEQNPTQTRQQTGIAAELDNFGVDIERDLLRAITGRPIDPQFGVRISGMDSLKIGTEVTLDKICPLLIKLKKAYTSDTYKQGPFAWVDHIGEIKDKSLHDTLDIEMLKCIHGGQFENTWLTIPKIVDWDRMCDFTYSSAAASPRYYDIKLSDMLKELGNANPDIGDLKHHKIYCGDADDNRVFSESCYKCIYSEVYYGSDVYVLNNGKWYKISHDFSKQVNAGFKKMPKYGKTLPDYDDKTEGDYNQRVSRQDTKSFLLCDKKNIKVSGAASPVEPCDLFRDGNTFIHVKRYGGSSILSHLFNQGLVAGELFQMEPDFRRQFDLRLPPQHQLADVNQRPKPNTYDVVFAIISESDEKNISIPFFSKISLKHVRNRLESIGFNVSLAKISVVDGKRKTVKYGVSSSRKIKVVENFDDD